MAIPDIAPKEFTQIRDFAHATFGLDLGAGKERLVSARLGRHLLAGGFTSFQSYFEHVRQDRSGESLHILIDALTTNHTSFLREAEHFRFLASELVPQLSRRREISIWSAASSTGEEVYTILFTLLEALSSSLSPGIRITGTDISTRAIRAAREASYGQDRLKALNPMWKHRYFERAEDGWRVAAQYRAMTTFRRLNLMDSFPSSFVFPVIFCRNVMIYFDKRTQADLVRRLTTALETGGYLFVGHAESLTGIDHELQYVRPAVYRKRA